MQRQQVHKNVQTTDLTSKRITTLTATLTIFVAISYKVLVISVADIMSWLLMVILYPLVTM